MQTLGRQKTIALPCFIRAPPHSLRPEDHIIAFFFNLWILFFWFQNISHARIGLQNWFCMNINTSFGWRDWFYPAQIRPCHIPVNLRNLVIPELHKNCTLKNSAFSRKQYFFAQGLNFCVNCNGCVPCIATVEEIARGFVHPFVALRGSP